MCQFYHICFSNLSCQSMPISTAEGCDTKKQPLSPNFNFCDPTWKTFFFFLMVASYFSTSLTCYSFNTNIAFFISHLEIFTYRISQRKYVSVFLSRICPPWHDCHDKWQQLPLPGQHDRDFHNFHKPGNL